MTKTYDFSVLDIRQHNFPFANLTATEIEEKKNAWEVHQSSDRSKRSDDSPAPAPAVSQAPKPVFKPPMNPPGDSNS